MRSSSVPAALALHRRGRRVKERRGERTGQIEGTGLGGVTSRGEYRPQLNVRVKWDDGREYITSHYALEVLPEPPIERSER